MKYARLIYIMDIKELENAKKEIEKNVKLLENSKFEKVKKLVKSGRQVLLVLRNEDLKNLFDVEEIKSVEKFFSTNKFSRNVKFYEINGGFIILK